MEKHYLIGIFIKQQKENRKERGFLSRKQAIIILQNKEF